MARRKQAVTINHVAAEAGVSLQTVSRVINNGANVRPEMQQRVQAAIDKLGYVPSIAAQRMSGSRSYLILALNDRDRTIADWRARQGTDWVDQMLLGGMLKCAEHGYRLIIELVDTPDPAAFGKPADHRAIDQKPDTVRADRFKRCRGWPGAEHGR